MQTVIAHLNLFIFIYLKLQDTWNKSSSKTMVVGQQMYLW